MESQLEHKEKRLVEEIFQHARDIEALNEELIDRGTNIAKYMMSEGDTDFLNSVISLPSSAELYLNQRFFSLLQPISGHDVQINGMCLILNLIIKIVKSNSTLSDASSILLFVGIFCQI